MALISPSISVWSFFCEEQEADFTFPKMQVVELLF